MRARLYICVHMGRGVQKRARARVSRAWACACTQRGARVRAREQASRACKRMLSLYSLDRCSPAVVPSSSAYPGSLKYGLATMIIDWIETRTCRIVEPELPAPLVEGHSHSRGGASRLARL